MDRDLALKRFNNQRYKAKSRGIGWELTFEQWLEWWGNDLDLRGPHVNQLQMQRPADSGPYALGNIRKGEAIDNAKTRGAVVRTKRTLIKAADLDRLRASSPAKAEESRDELGDDEQWMRHHLGYRTSKIARWEPKP